VCPPVVYLFFRADLFTRDISRSAPIEHVSSPTGMIPFFSPLVLRQLFPFSIFPPSPVPKDDQPWILLNPLVTFLKMPQVFFLYRYQAKALSVPCVPFSPIKCSPRTNWLHEGEELCGVFVFLVVFLLVFFFFWFCFLVWLFLFFWGFVAVFRGFLGFVYFSFVCGGWLFLVYAFSYAFVSLHLCVIACCYCGAGLVTFSFCVGGVEMLCFFVGLVCLLGVRLLDGSGAVCWGPLGGGLGLFLF